MNHAAAQPLRRDPQGGLLAGVCAGLGARLGLDPIVVRLGFVAAAAAGGFGVVLYALAWALLPADGPERQVVARLLSRRDSWLLAAGIGCLVLAGLLLLREWGIWFSDATVWPVVLAATGGALLWRQSTAPPPPNVPIEVVTVGDAPLDGHAEALIAGAREALVNAAKFAGDRRAPGRLGEDGRGARLHRPAQAPALQPPPAVTLGRGAAAGGLR